MLRGAGAAGFFLVGIAACGARPLEPRDPDPGAFHFTIESYNVRDDMEGDRRTVQALGIPDADIVCVQEITPVWQEAIEAVYATKYPYRLFNADIEQVGGAGGLGIMSRFPVRDGGFHPGPNGWHPAWHFFVDGPHGTFKVLNVHLRNATGDHGNIVNSLLTTPDDHVYEIQVFSAANTVEAPTIVAGDFNEGPDGAAVGLLESLGYSNALPLFHPGQPTFKHRSVGAQFTEEIDHVLFDPSFEPLNAWAVNAGDSDHLPVVAHLEAVGDRW